MFGINELKAAVSCSEARALRQHAEVMEELHDIHMQIETLYDVLDRAMKELTPKEEKKVTIYSPELNPQKANHLKKKGK